MFPTKVRPSSPPPHDPPPFAAPQAHAFVTPRGGSTATAAAAAAAASTSTSTANAPVSVCMPLLRPHSLSPKWSRVVAARRSARDAWDDDGEWEPWRGRSPRTPPPPPPPRKPPTPPPPPLPRTPSPHTASPHDTTNATNANPTAALSRGGPRALVVLPQATQFQRRRIVARSGAPGRAPRRTRRRTAGLPPTRPAGAAPAPTRLRR